MNWMPSLSVSPHSPPAFPRSNPHSGTDPLAGIFLFVTYISMMDDDPQDESLVLGDSEDEELEGDEKY